ncbi:hypothetical protein HJD18_00645 [Thermoleophilia bacterium SCSIO 60948]|nr:hypothetical protein HJD18_00645 [Thermoleophilia bacterium SCSIO 60948]
MRRLLPARLNSKLLPVAVAGLVIPSALAFAFVGVQFGLVMGAVLITAIIVRAATLRYDEPIEVADRTDSRYRMLIVATSPLEFPGAAEEIATLAGEGAKATRSAGPPEATVLAPALATRLDRWATDLGPSRLAAQERLSVALAALAAAGVDATGRVGDERIVQAVEDLLAEYPAQEVAFVDDGSHSNELGEIRRRLDRPVRGIESRASASRNG